MIRVPGEIDAQHRLFAEVPESVPPGPVMVLIVPVVGEDDAGVAWMNGVSHQWQDVLSDPREDIYTIEDGEPVSEA
jgi:hypothetical protein